jgi:hypothetical protein
MNLFHGVHEIRMLGPSGISAGYFDSWDSALQAVEKEIGLYKAVWFSLNPINLPAEIPVNPPVLTPARHTADPSDIARRVWLLVDVDPPRPADSNSTDSEKQAAREQAESVREYLRGRNCRTRSCVTRATVGTCFTPSNYPTMTPQRNWCAACWHGSSSCFLWWTR